MAVKKTGLGKGLEALFSENQLTKEEEKKIKDGEEIVQKIKVIEIEPNRNQPRRNFPSESIEELAKSIEKYGVIQPIIVSKKDGYYEIVAGERRWRAAKKAGLKEMPCIVRENDERKNKEIALIENIQREDLNPIDKARGFRQLLDDYGMTQQQLADTIGLNRSTVTNTLRLLNLDERVMQLAIDGKLNEGHCRSLLCITDADKQYAAAIRIIEKGETVRDIEKKVQDQKKTSHKYEERRQAICRDIEDSFQSFFGTKVKLNAGKRSGKIIIQSKYFVDMIRKMPSDLIDFEVEDNLKIKISTPNNQYRLNCYNPNDYPNISLEKSGDVINIESSTLRDIISQTSYALSTQEVRPLLTGINLKINGDILECICTDSYRLSKKNIKLATPVNKQVNIVIPGRSITELEKIIADDVNVEVYVFTNKILFVYKNIYVQSNLLSGTYPETSHFIPNDFAYMINLNMKEFYDAVDRAALLAQNKEKNIIKMHIQDKEMVITSNSNELGNAEEKLHIDCNNKEKITNVRFKK